MSAHPVDDHLARFTGAQAKALQTTRERIAAALPGAEQVIAYGMPTFKVDGVAVVGFDGFKAHNSLFPYSGGVVALVAEARPDRRSARAPSSSRSPRRSPAALLKRVIALRIDEINEGYPKRGGETKEFYDNGCLKLKGQTKAGQMHGTWRWWRRDGSLMRTGSFQDGVQTGEWTTYDRNGEPVKTTRF